MEKDLKKPRKLTKKQRIFVAEYAKSENSAQAVMKAYDVKDNVVAANIGSENLGKPYIIEAIDVKRKSLKQALIDRGIDENYIAERVEVLLDAKDENGRKDYATIDKGLKHATTIYGVTDNDGNPTQRNTYNFLFADGTREEIKEIEEKIKARLLMKKKNVEEN